MTDQLMAEKAVQTCWIVLRSEQRRAALTALLESAGWEVQGQWDHPAAACAALEAMPGPEVLVTGLHFDGGDALPLLRQLGRRQPGAGLYVLSSQQRAVIQAAVTLAEVCGLRIIGTAEEPASGEAVVETLREFQAKPHDLGRPHRPQLPGLTALRRMVAERRLQAWLQPQLRLVSWEIARFEALMRGIDDEGRVVTPDRLVPALMAAGLLEDATLQMLDQTAAFISSALDHGMSLSGSVNISLSTLSDPAFCLELPRLLDTHGLDPSWITLEVTETDAMAEIDEVVENAARIRMLGFNLAIDDFGTAYSSLTQLMAIPFSELKLDRSFVRDADRDVRRRAIVGACASLGASLGLQVVAEGVETDSELRTVFSCGCTHVQGYRVARPLPAEQLLPWLNNLKDQLWRDPIAVDSAAVPQDRRVGTGSGT